MDAQFLGHADDGRQDGATLPGERMQECHIEFQRMEMVILEDIQRGIAAAEIVEPDVKPGFLEPVQASMDGVILEDQGVFGGFRIEKVPGQLVLRQGFFQQLHGVHELEIQPGEIEGDRQDWPALLHLVVEEESHGFCHIAVQPVDQPEFLERRNEEGRGEQAVFRGVPASQGFKAADFAVQGADDGWQ